MPGFFRSTRHVVLVPTLTFLLVSMALAAVPPEDVAAGHATRWILVRLDAPLSPPDGGRAFPLVTGRPALDAALRAARVERIELALTNAGPHRGRWTEAGFDRLYKFFLPPGAVIADVVGLFARTDGVTRAEPDFVGHGAATVPNDRRFDLQWGLSQASDHDVDAPEGWDFATGSPAVIIAVLDTGVDFAHEDFVGKTVPGWDFVNDDDDPQDDYGHGSSTASIAAANTNNAYGVAGACWNCRIMPLKDLDEENQGYTAWWVDALTWAADHGAAIANMSEGGPSNSTALHDAVIYAYEAGVVIPACTMNYDTWVPFYPAAYEEAIAVGGTDALDQRADPFCNSAGSNYGPHVDVVAPGDDILGAALGGGCDYWCGTSQATPFVSGLAGLIESIDPGAGREEIRHLIRAGAADRVGRASEDTPGFDQYMGWGRVDFRRTLDAARALVSLRVSGNDATRVYLEHAADVATSYDVVRGALPGLSESAARVSLGPVTCLANDLAVPDTAGGHEDSERPGAGSAFFYLVRFTAAPGAGSYGGSTRHRDRVPASGGCAG